MIASLDYAFLAVTFVAFAMAVSLVVTVAVNMENNK